MGDTREARICDSNESSSAIPGAVTTTTHKDGDETLYVHAECPDCERLKAQLDAERALWLPAWETHERDHARAVKTNSRRSSRSAQTRPPHRRALDSRA